MPPRAAAGRRSGNGGSGATTISLDSVVQRIVQLIRRARTATQPPASEDAMLRAVQQLSEETASDRKRLDFDLGDSIKHFNLGALRSGADLQSSTVRELAALIDPSAPMMTSTK